MAAHGVWDVSAHTNAPESPYDSFLRNPRGKDGKLRLQPKQQRTDDDWLVFQSAFKD